MAHHPDQPIAHHPSDAPPPPRVPLLSWAPPTDTPPASPLAAAPTASPVAAPVAAPLRRSLTPIVASAALALGALGDALLRPAPWGLGAALWVAAVAAALLAVARLAPVPALAGRNALAVAPILAAAAGLAWRDSDVLKTLDVLAIFLALAWLAVRTVPTIPTTRASSLAASALRRFRRPGATDYALAAFAAGWQAVAGAVPLLTAEVGWQSLAHRGGPDAPWRRHGLALSRGLLLALPALLIFGALLAAADAVFADLLRRALLPDLGAALPHLLLALALAWPAAGYLRAVARDDPTPRPVVAPPPSLRLGAVEVGVLLGSLDALFLLFVLVQGRYLFGGGARVETSTSLTYAEYARRGFFELVAVAALALPLLLLVDWLLRRPPDPAARRATLLFRLLAGLQLALLAVVLLSALQRMRLYHREYGLSELRVYTVAFMLWIAALLAWFTLTVLRGRREPFAAGALLAAALALAALHALNPDALIVRANADLAASPNGRPFDAPYAATLSADAAPGLLDILRTLPEPDRCLLATRLREDHLHPPQDWRTWSLSLTVARRAVRDREAELQPCAPIRSDTATEAAEPGGPWTSSLSADPALPAQPRR